MQTLRYSFNQPPFPPIANLRQQSPFSPMYINNHNLHQSTSTNYHFHQSPSKTTMYINNHRFHQLTSTTTIFTNLHQKPYFPPIYIRKHHCPHFQDEPSHVNIKPHQGLICARPKASQFQTFNFELSLI